MKVQVLYVSGCPNHQAAVELVRSVAPQVRIEEVEVRTADDAERMRFLGSPTILVDGVDIEPRARSRTDFGLSCRTYAGKGLPSRKMVSSALAGDRRSASDGSQSLWLAAGSVGIAVVASACCWLPLLLFGLGMSAFGLSAKLEVIGPWLFGTAAVLLAGAFYLSSRKVNCCAAESNREFNAEAITGPKGTGRAPLWIAVALVLTLALPATFFGAVANAVRGRACCLPMEADAPRVAFAAASATDGAHNPAEQSPARLTVLSDDLHELKSAFNADQGAVRVMLIVSPQCPACRRGAQQVEEQALERIGGDRLKVYVVWIHRLFRDSRDAAQDATRLVADKRSRHFWDGAGRLGREYGKILKLPHEKKFAWDVYFVFDPQAIWSDKPPTPDFWMHQLGGRDTGNMLDGGKFREAIVQRLAK